MRAKVIKIGNSRGIRIPKSIIEQSGLNDEVELEVRNDQIIIKSISTNKRENWDLLFKKMAQNKDVILLDTDALAGQTIWDNNEWLW
jgi:antitoxin MazE